MTSIFICSRHTPPFNGHIENKWLQSDHYFSTYNASGVCSAQQTHFYRYRDIKVPNAEILKEFANIRGTSSPFNSPHNKKSSKDETTLGGLPIYVPIRIQQVKNIFKGYLKVRDIRQGKI